MSDPIFTLNSRQALGLGQWLNTQALSGRESRERSKFVEQINEFLKDVEETRLAIVEKYAELDENKKPKTVTENGNSHFVVKDEDLPKFNEEMNQYLDNTSFIVSGPGNIQRLKVVKQLVIDTTEKIPGAIAGDYDKWCEAFEAVEV